MERAEYQEALAKLERLRPTGFSSTFRGLSYLLGPRRITSDLGSKAQRLADQLGRIGPPPDVAAEHTALVCAVRRAASDLSEVAQRKGMRAFERFEAMAEIDFGEAEMRALEAKGYRLPK
jgi:hypothetical protein